MTPSLAEATAAARRIQARSYRFEPTFDVLADADLLAGFVLAGDTSLEAGSDSAWPVREVLRVLADAANHLLREHDCDCLGWETIEAARQAAVELQARPHAGDTARLRTALENLLAAMKDATPTRRYYLPSVVRDAERAARAAIAEGSP